MDDIIAVLQIAYNRKKALTTSRCFLGNIIDDSEGEKINEEETKSHVWVVNEAFDSTAASSRESAAAWYLFSFVYGS
jgi:hypothetical protein